jgi:hypothetical protein
VQQSSPDDEHCTPLANVEPAFSPQALLNPKPPKELSQWFSDEAAYRKIQAYSLDK